VGSIYFAVICKGEDGEEYLEDYIEAASWDVARLEACKKYGLSVSVEYAKDEDVEAFFAETDKEREEEWREDAAYERVHSDPYEDQGGVDITQAAELDVICKEKLTDEEIKSIISKGRLLGNKFVTKSQLRKVKGEVLYSKCVDCGVQVPYTTRPHERCEKCLIKHRRIYRQKHKRLERLK